MLQPITVFLTGSEKNALSAFLGKVHYGTVYPLVEHSGDGNKLGSPSDIETRQTLEALRRVKSAVGRAEGADR